MEDSIDDEFHLTPRGWVNGTHFYFKQAEKAKIIERPNDCVETWVREMRQSSSFSTEHVEWKLIWTSPDYSESEKATLKKRYPRPNH